MRLLAPFVIIVLLAAGIVVWLHDVPPDADIVFVNQNEVFTLDPQRMSYLQDLRLAQALYEGLARWNNDDYSVLPAAAVTLPEISADGREYVFRLRENARWSNGDPVTAHDFIYAWQRAILPDTAADYSNLFFIIKGAEACFAWRAQQCADFAADPYDSVEAERSRQTLGMVRRLRRLLAVDSLPNGIDPPGADQRAVLNDQLTQLDQAAADGAGELDAVLADADAVRGWFNLLDTRASRQAEAEWMWEETQKHFSKTVGLNAADNHTLHVRLTQPTAYFLDLLCFGIFFPVHRPTVEGWIVEDQASRRTIAESGWHTVEPPAFDQRRWVRLDPGTGKLQQRHAWAKPDRHVGNGPYRLAQWRYKRDLRLEKNDLYHDADRVRSQTILALTIEDTNTAVLAFESGQVDWLVDVSATYEADMIAQRLRYEEHHAEALRQLRARGLTIDEALAALPLPGTDERRNIHVLPAFGTEFFSFNCRPRLSDGRPNPFAESAVRRAFALSIDKKSIVEHATRLNEPVINTLIPPGSIPGYSSPDGLPHNPERAREEFRAAGWFDRDGDGLVEDERGELFPVIDLLFTTNTPRYKWMSLNLKAQWEHELGVRVELRGAETKFYKEDLKQGKFMIARGRWYGDYGDPTTFLELCRSTDGNNDRKYASEHVDDLLDRAARETDLTERTRLLEECERFLFEEELPLLPICQLVHVYMYEPGTLRGLSHHPRLDQFLWEMEVVEE